MRRTSLSLAACLAIGLVACTGESTPTTPSDPAVLGTRTYSQDIRPITSGQGCRTCHANPPIGSYEQDKVQRNNIARMARINGRTAGLTQEQIQAIQDWVAAGAPDDQQKF